jgi:hypothetical protein
MPRFFFNVHIVDEEGVELTGPDEARSQAIATAGEMLRNKGPELLARNRVGHAGDGRERRHRLRPQGQATT